MIKIFYKIKHLPSNLFFKSGQGMGRCLTKIGKTYDKLPSLQYVKSGLVDKHRDEEGNIVNWNRDYPNRKVVKCLSLPNKKYIEFKVEEWKIMKYTAIEEEIND